MGKSFRRDQFLLYMLASIFLVQACIFVYGVTRCLNQPGMLRNCPDIGRRYDQTFGVMVATTLALLTGSQLSQSPSSGASRDVPGSSSQQAPRLQERAKVQEKEPESEKALKRPLRPSSPNPSSEQY